MRLAEYLDSQIPKMTAKAFAETIGVDPSMVTRWRRQQTIPDPVNIRAIVNATDGLVTANDFFHPAVDEAAEFHTAPVEAAA